MCIAYLIAFNAPQITTRERSDSELFYLSAIMQEGVVSDDARAKSHYHWNNLCESE